MRSATAGVCGSSRRIPRPRLPPACSFFSGKKKGTGLRRRGRGAPRPGNSYSFVGRHHVPVSVRTFGAPDVVLQGPEILIPSSRGTTSLSPSGPAAPRTWCSKARNPYSFVERHHVPRLGWPSGARDVVLHGPQILILSSRGTTSIGSAGPSAPGTWCSMVRKSLFLRREAPRP